MARRDGPYEPRIREIFRTRFRENRSSDAESIATDFQQAHYALSIPLSLLIKWAIEEKENINGIPQNC